jgi:hypothetical protein
MLPKFFECLENALNNVPTEFIRVHISNNASTDNTIEVCKPFLNDKITFDSNDTNINFLGNILKGFSLDVGQQYTWILGDDDWVTPWSLANLFNYFAELDSKKIVVKCIAINLLVLSKDFLQNPNLFDLVEKNQVTGFSWLLNQKFKQPIVVPFKQLLDPYVDDQILGAIAGIIFDSSLVRESLKKLDYSKFYFEHMQEIPKSQYVFPHSYAYFHAFLSEDLCLSIPDVFWVASVGHQEWQNILPTITMASFDSLFKCFDLGLIDNLELEDYSKKLFLRHMRHFSNFIQKSQESLSERKLKMLLKCYAWFVSNNINSIK